MIRILIETQVIENYDLEAGEDSTYWKPKWGDEYIVECQSIEDVYRATQYGKAKVTVAGGGFVEYPVTERVLGFDEKTPTQKMYEESGDRFEPKILKYN